MAKPFVCLVMLAMVMKTSCTDDLANTVSTVGANVTMICRTRSGNCSGVSWRTYPEFRMIYDGELGFGGNYHSRYIIDATSGCHLIIKNVQLTDAVRMLCIDESFTSTIAKGSELIVLESEPKCHLSASEKTTEEEDMVILTCDVTFNGNNSVLMTWKDMKNVPPSSKVGNVVKLVHNVTAERPLVPSYECIASFEIVTVGTDLVSNIPTVSCKTLPIKILYGVKRADLTPSQSVHSFGSSVNCSSDGNPPPTFKWEESETKNGPWKDVVDVTGQTFFTSNETSHYYRCVANNIVKNYTYTAFSSSFRVNYPAETTETVIGSTNSELASSVPTEAGPSAGVLMLIVVVVSSLCCVLLLVVIVIAIC